jgi:hypothetical protein
MARQDSRLQMSLQGDCDVIVHCPGVLLGHVKDRAWKTPIKQNNCRSEEPGGSTIATYPRAIEGLTRRTESKRKRQREARKERQAAVVQSRKEEVKRLKNLKVQEVQDTCACCPFDHCAFCVLKCPSGTS